MRRRDFIAGLSVAAIPPLNDAHAQRGSPSSATRVERGLVLNVSGFGMLLNFAKQSRRAVLLRSGHVEGKEMWARGYLDSNGNLNTPVPPEVTGLSVGILELGYVPPYFPTLEGEAIEITWEGGGTCVVDWLTGAPAKVNNAAKFATFVVGPKPSNTRARFLVTDRSNPPRNPRIFLKRHSNAVYQGENLSLDWLAQARKFPVLRFMDLMATNGSEISSFEEIADEAFCSWGHSSTEGGKSGFPLSLICEVSLKTGADIWFCFPAKIRDEGARKIATYFRDNMPPGRTVWFEYSNEYWNWGFSQTSWMRDQSNTRWPGANNPNKFGGYRAAQLAQIVRDVYNDRSRWEFSIATQTVWADNVTAENIKGVKLALSESKGRTHVHELFSSIAVTNYFGGDYAPAGWLVQSIERGSPTRVRSDHNGLKKGDRIRFNIDPRAGRGGMVELHDRTVIVTAIIDQHRFEIGIDSTAFTSLTPGVGTVIYCTKADVFDLIDQSAALNRVNPAEYKTIFTHFARQVRTKMFEEIERHRIDHWPKQKSYADANNLRLCCYEGGSHFLGYGELQGSWGTDGDRGNALGDRFTHWNIAIAHGSEVAEAHSKSFEEFWAFGGLASKYIDSGIPGAYGTWGGIRWWPRVKSPEGDVGNPVWRAVVAAARGN